MSERILMPLDGSKMGESALSYVNDLISRLAPDQTVEILLFNVITMVRRNIRYSGGGTVSVPYTEDELSQLKKEAMAYLERVSKKLQNPKLSINCSVTVNENPAEAIIQAEKEFNADLVAMATHGRSGISRFALGSIAEKVMRGGGIPVLMVRSED